MLTQFFFFTIAVSAATAIHEVAHLAVAKLLRLRVVKFQLGIVEIVRFRCLDTTYMLGAVWISGSTLVVHDMASNNKPKKIAVYSAGIVTNLLSAALAHCVVQHPLTELFVHTSLIIAAANALPFGQRDGAQLYRLLRR